MNHSVHYIPDLPEDSILICPQNNELGVIPYVCNEYADIYGLLIKRPDLLFIKRVNFVLMLDAMKFHKEYERGF